MLVLVVGTSLLTTFSAATAAAQVPVVVELGEPGDPARPPGDPPRPGDPEPPAEPPPTEPPPAEPPPGGPPAAPDPAEPAGPALPDADPAPPNLARTGTPASGLLLAGLGCAALGTALVRTRHRPPHLPAHRPQEGTR